MINKYEFHKLLEKIERNTMTVHADPDKRSATFEDWYERFGKTDYFLLKKAVDLLIDTHTLKKFPMISEMFSAIRGARSSMPVEKEMDESDCLMCFGQGLQIVPMKNSSGKAVPCECHLGRVYENAWRNHDRRGDE